MEGGLAKNRLRGSVEGGDHWSADRRAATASGALPRKRHVPLLDFNLDNGRSAATPSPRRRHATAVIAARV